MQNRWSNEWDWMNVEQCSCYSVICLVISSMYVNEQLPKWTSKPQKKIQSSNSAGVETSTPDSSLLYCVIATKMSCPMNSIMFDGQITFISISNSANSMDRKLFENILSKVDNWIYGQNSALWLYIRSTSSSCWANSFSLLLSNWGTRPQ